MPGRVRTLMVLKVEAEMRLSFTDEATAKLELCFITRQKWSRERSLHSVNDHFEAIFNAVRERKVVFPYNSDVIPSDLADGVGRRRGANRTGRIRCPWRWSGEPPHDVEGNQGFFTAT
uniref:Uncharacterized protein n=1 Tax=Candidatus Kentrum sp. DK TaxID=2126562 RepID=A0A450S4B9_9GAMM|nr:MAG: hypothetical protein BECKDK2373C_GA0170839_101543 [Candidatus Kentron sp. DK]